VIEACIAAARKGGIDSICCHDLTRADVGSVDPGSFLLLALELGLFEKVTVLFPPPVARARGRFLQELDARLCALGAVVDETGLEIGSRRLHFAWSPAELDKTAPLWLDIDADYLFDYARGGPWSTVAGAFRWRRDFTVEKATVTRSYQNGFLPLKRRYLGAYINALLSGDGEGVCWGDGLEQGYAALHAGASAEAEAIYDQLMADHPRDLDVCVLGTYLASYTEQRRQERQRRKAARRLAGDTPQQECNRRICRMLNGVEEAAPETLERYGRRGDPQTAALAARALAAAGNWDAALAASRRVLAGGSSQEALAVLSLVCAWRLQFKAHDFLELFGFLDARGPYGPAYTALAARIYFALGELGRARPLLEQAVEEWPEDRRLRVLQSLTPGAAHGAPAGAGSS